MAQLQWQRFARAVDQRGFTWLRALVQRRILSRGAGARTLALLALTLPLASLAGAETPTPAQRARLLVEALKDEKDAPSTPPSEALRHARKALRQSEGARKEGQVPRAELLGAQALEWAQVEKSLRRAVALEHAAKRDERQVAELERELKRTQALLEETAARQGRAESQLKKLAASNAAPSKKAPSPKTGKKKPSPPARKP